ncbi:MAG: glycoside hydrolase family 3 N-terminal domain-containing protein [Anaerolineales bacterium]
MSMRRFFHWFTLLALLASFLSPVSATVYAQTSTPASKAEALLSTMTPEERVGQLFLVTFTGTDTAPESQVYDLIARHHVGGVVLQASNDNFLAAPDSVTSAHQLINALQTIEWDTSTDNQSQTAATYVPLFIGVSQEGDGIPHDQILSGMTPLPNEMAIGATWKTDLARQVGNVLGSELSAMGFNLFLGPSLDVLESPNPTVLSDLGTRVFGGDPFWVGQMGKEYIAGLHQGSNDRMVVVAKHFPGRGSSDRSPEEEVATVRKSLEQLKQIELYPFTTVTTATEPGSQADGLLVSHIRYTGFQGNIRATTRPVSFDPEALSIILQLPELATWHANGGLMVSDALGSKAVRDFYAQGGVNYSPRTVSRDALLAGNDLLYLGNVTSNDLNENSYTSTLKVLEFFSQQYSNDSSFAQLVDDAVLKILAQKFRMYDNFALANVLTPESRLLNVGTSQQVSVDVARNAATLINPDPLELSTLLPAPPDQSDWIVYLTDSSTYKQCSTCLSQDFFATNSLEQTTLSLYGPAGSGQVAGNRLRSFPFAEIQLMLNGESKTTIEDDLGRATWVVISLTDVSSGQIGLIRRLFTERPNLLRNKNVILFSFTAPYYLDATDISKLTAYYTLYSKQPAFVDAAVRLLFRPSALQGASPVSVTGVGYNLIDRTSPNPTQVIPLALDSSPIIVETVTPAAGEVTQTPAPTEVPLFRIGDTISVRAGPIIDQNGHIVPDETPVRFIMSTKEGTGGIQNQVEATTINGLARASFVIDKPGIVEISAVSEPAMVSAVLQFNASEVAAPVIIVTPQVTFTPTPILPTSTPTPVNDLITPEGYPRIGVWLLVMLAIFGGAFLSFWAVSRLVSTRWGLRWALCIFLGGLLAYNYLALGFPGATNWVAAKSGAFGVLVLTFAGEAIGGLTAWAWMTLFSEPGSREG